MDTTAQTDGKDNSYIPPNFFEGIYSQYNDNYNRCVKLNSYNMQININENAEKYIFFRGGGAFFRL